MVSLTICRSTCPKATPMSVLTIANLLHSSPVAWDHLTKTTPTHSRIHHQHSPAQSRLLHGDYTGYHGTNKTEPSCPDPRSGLRGERGRVRATTGLSDHPHYPPKRCEERWSLVRLTTVRCLAAPHVVTPPCRAAHGTLAGARDAANICRAYQRS